MTFEQQANAAKAAAGTDTNHSQTPRGPRAAGPPRSLGARDRSGRLRWDTVEDDPEFQSAASLLMTDLTPEGAIESYLAEMVMDNFRRLYLLRKVPQNARTMKLEMQLHRSTTQAMKLLDRRQRERKQTWGKARPSPTAAPIAPEAPVATPVVETQRGRPVVEEPDPVVADSEGVEWRDCLVFDPNVSDVSPVIKGTWVTARHVVSLIVDGWSWDEVLKAHPELTEGHIRACLAYTIDEEGGASS